MILTRKAAAAMPRPMAIVEAIAVAMRTIIVQYDTNRGWLQSVHRTFEHPFVPTLEGWIKAVALGRNKFRHSSTQHFYGITRFPQHDLKRSADRFRSR